MTHRYLLVLAVFLGMTSCDQHIDYIQSYYYNEKYRYYLNQKAFEKALNAELQSKEKLQDRYELDSNLGIVFNLLNKNPESEKSFDEALKSIEKNYPEMSEEKLKALFLVHYNRGVFFQTQDKVDEALADYQKALDVNPTSIETKTNIELLIQKQQDQKKKQGQGQGGQQSEQDKKDNKQDGQDGQNGEKNDDKKNDNEGDKQQNNKDKEDQKEGQNRKQNAKYQPRPFKGDQLSEGDVKKILGELSQQDKKIRSQFNKKEKEETGVDGKNEKDW